MEAFGIISHIELKNNTLGVTYNLTNNRFEGEVNFVSEFFDDTNLVECINAAINKSTFLHVFEPKISIDFGEKYQTMTIRIMIKVLPPLKLKNETHTFILTTLTPNVTDLPIINLSGNMQVLTIPKERKIIKLDFYWISKSVTVLENDKIVASSHFDAKNKEMQSNLGCLIGAEPSNYDAGKFIYDLDFIRDFVDCSEIHKISASLNTQNVSIGDEKYGFNMDITFVEKMINSYLNNKDIFLESILCGLINPHSEKFKRMQPYVGDFQLMSVILFVNPHLVPNKRKFYFIDTFDRFLALRKSSKNYTILSNTGSITIVEEVQ